MFDGNVIYEMNPVGEINVPQEDKKPNMNDDGKGKISIANSIMTVINLVRVSGTGLNAVWKIEPYIKTRDLIEMVKKGTVVFYDTENENFRYPSYYCIDETDPAADFLQLWYTDGNMIYDGKTFTAITGYFEISDGKVFEDYQYFVRKSRIYKQGTNYRMDYYAKPEGLAREISMGCQFTAQDETTGDVYRAVSATDERVVLVCETINADGKLVVKQLILGNSQNLMYSEKTID